MDEIAIVLTCDDRYIRHAAATIISVVKNSKRRFHFYLFDCGIKPENIQKLLQWDLGDNKIEVVNIKKQAVFENFHVHSRYTSAIFYRLVIPEVLAHLDKAIFMDADIIVLGDLGEVWDISMENCLLGAVSEEDNFFPAKIYKARKLRIGMPLHAEFFNSGFLLLNLDALRQWKLFERVTNFFKTNTCPHITLQDQDALNLLIDRDRYISLPAKFNCSIRSHLGDKNPTCIHFILKIWWFRENFVKYFLRFFYPHSVEYFKYAHLTPFADKINEDASYLKAFSWLWKFTFLPIEHFIRFKIRDPFMNVIRTHRRNSGKKSTK